MQWSRRFAGLKAFLSLAVAGWSGYEQVLRRMIALGRMAKPGLEAFERRDPKKTGIYSFEQRPSTLDRTLEREFKGHAAAWTFFRAQPPGYQRLAIFWVMSAKQQGTRERRLAALVKTSAEGKRIL